MVLPALMGLLSWLGYGWLDFAFQVWAAVHLLAAAASAGIALILSARNRAIAREALLAVLVLVAAGILVWPARILGMHLLLAEQRGRVHEYDALLRGLNMQATEGSATNKHLAEHGLVSIAWDESAVVLQLDGRGRNALVRVSPDVHPDPSCLLHIEGRWYLIVGECERVQ